MTKKILISLAGAGLAAAALHAQTSLHGTALQPQSWMAAPGSEPMRIEGRQSGPVVGKPFSATEVRRTVQTLSDGTHVDHSDTSRFYRDSEGRMRAESPNRVEIFDPVAGFEYDLNPRDKTYKKNAIPDKTVSMSVAVVGYTSWTSFSDEGDLARRQQSGREDLAPQVINGINVKGSRIARTIPAGTFGNDRAIKVVNERWYSDDLQVLVKSSNSDPRFGVSTYELTNIVQAPPDSALFLPPADYKETQHH